MLVTDTCLTSYNYFGVTHPQCVICGNTHMAAHLLHHTIYSVAVSPHNSNPPSHSLTPVSALCSKPNTVVCHGTSTMGNHSTSHAYQLCQLSNGRTGRPAGAQKKRRPSKQQPAFIIATRSNIVWRHIKKEVTSFDCPATLPFGPGTPPLSLACS